tara:strand:+ start:17891 stop:19141 length:1251 start_codon:yes stop_codon:yes gene_type:complete
MNSNITYVLDVNNIYNFTNNEDYTEKKYSFNNVDYKIIKYNKEKLIHYKENDYNKFIELSKFRSVFFKGDKLCAFSPPKSVEYSSFIKKYTNVSECWVEDFIDGTMINLFYDTTNNNWEITTKSTIGGNIMFFNNPNMQVKKTFRDMFFEACNYNNFNINSLPSKYSYTFIMQHPENRIVTPNEYPKIFLLKIYEISYLSDLKYQITEINTANFSNTPPYVFSNTGINVVCKYVINSYDDIQKYYENDDIPFYCVGAMIYNKNGDRTKIRNKNYELVRKLRGNQPKLQYHYLCLKKENKIKEFLSYYPEHINDFKEFKVKMFYYTNNLYLKYIECFIKKVKPLKDYEFQYKNHLYKIHEKYKNELVANKMKVDKKVVIDYINGLHPAQQMFVINYEDYNKNIENENNIENNEEMQV